MIVPVLNEADNLDPLLDELLAVLASTGRAFEIIAIDDGSTDSSFDRLLARQRRDDRIRVVQFRRNFGQTAAIAAGFDRARGGWVVTIDADLQNDPADIPLLLAKAEEGFDVVSGWREHRRDSLLRRLPSRVANWLIGIVTGLRLRDYGCSLKVYHRDVAKNVKLYGELHRFIPAVATSLGIQVAELSVNHRARVRGDSKYSGIGRTLTRTAKVVLDLITVRFLLSYSTRPIHVFGGLGIVAGLAGFAIASWLTYIKLFRGEALRDRPLLMLAVLLVVVGFQLVTMGLLGELVVRTYHESQKKPIYAVRETTDSGSAADAP